jgi:hypothetical protein
MSSKSPTISPKLTYAKLILQVANLPAQGRLGDVQPRRRACHILLFGDGDEVAEVAEFHARQHTPPVWLAKEQSISRSSGIRVACS